LKTPIIYSTGPIFAQGDYDVFVGALEENKLPTYVVINRTSGVVEFTHEVTLAYKSFLDQVAPAPNPLANERPFGQLNLNLKN
jgi:hypothetical protein